jgi:hypothetical protein
MIMPKKVKVKLNGIGKEIDLAERQLSAAGRKVKSREEKKKVAAKVKKLKKAKAMIKVLCRKTYTILVPTA